MPCSLEWCVSAAVGSDLPFPCGLVGDLDISTADGGKGGVGMCARWFPLWKRKRFSGEQQFIVDYFTSDRPHIVGGITDFTLDTSSLKP